MQNCAAAIFAAFNAKARQGSIPWRGQFNMGASCSMRPNGKWIPAFAGMTAAS
jgi:hypothetical protein